MSIDEVAGIEFGVARAVADGEGDGESGGKAGVFSATRLRPLGEFFSTAFCFGGLGPPIISGGLPFGGLRFCFLGTCMVDDSSGVGRLINGFASSSGRLMSTFGSLGSGVLTTAGIFCGDMTERSFRGRMVRRSLVGVVTTGRSGKPSRFC